MEGEEERDEGMILGFWFEEIGQIVVLFIKIGKIWKKVWFEFRLGYVEFGVFMGQLSVDVRWVVGYKGLEFRGEV